MSWPLPTGSWLGVVGGGQLGRMFAMEAQRIGFRVAVLDPDPTCPAGRVADRHVAQPYADPNAQRTFAQGLSALTLEFEHVDPAAITGTDALCPMTPSPAVALMKRDRLAEKQGLRAHGFPLADFAPARSAAELRAAVASIGLPAVLKSTTEGYDGKGQRVLRTMQDAAEAEALYGGEGALRYVLERLILFTKELSVICARGRDGQTRCFPVVENVHLHGILDTTLAPAPVPANVAAAAQELAVTLAQRLDVVGLVAAELFLLPDGGLLINELAFRPHNSGHYTIEGCATSQFEQLTRVLAGLPLGSTELVRPTAMANLLGDLWPAGGEPNFAQALTVEGVRLHLYGKTEARPGRKMGHLTATATSRDEALERVLEARRRLTA
ncbi:MAG: 5-(carboxyamino)imidazole ribonucleotide synthase [Chloroflexota bacterium]